MESCDAVPTNEHVCALLLLHTHEQKKVKMHAIRTLRVGWERQATTATAACCCCIYIVEKEKRAHW